MKNKRLTQDEFARFIAHKINTTKRYSFDVFYDVQKIMNELVKHTSNSQTPVKKTYYLMTRDTGIDLVTRDNDNFTTYAKRNTKIYTLTFCWNYTYFYPEPFCEITRIKNLNT